MSPCLSCFLLWPCPYRMYVRIQSCKELNVRQGRLGGSMGHGMKGSTKTEFEGFVDFEKITHLLPNE